eukprot:COSAG04_NODE_19306_length_419_cov_0.940625_2_plen_54_part_01
MRTGTQHTEPDRTAETPISSPLVWSRIAGGTAKYWEGSSAVWRAADFNSTGRYL